MQQTQPSSMKCPCGSQQAFVHCCEPYIVGKAHAESPETLMRSRYSAYATKHYDYILMTYASAEREAIDIDSLKRHDKDCIWKRLDVIATHDAQVEFRAFYLFDGVYFCMHERSYFVLEEGRWRYQRGDMLGDNTKLDIGRNSPCPCGSSKKFKRCCSS